MRQKRGADFHFDTKAVEVVDEIGAKLGLDREAALLKSIAIAKHIVNLAAEGTKFPLLHPDGRTTWLDLEIQDVEATPDFSIPPDMQV